MRGRAARETTPAGAASAARDTARSTGDEDADRRAREIRADIEQTREDMSETIDAIQERLRPGHIVSEATDRVKTATTERVKHMVGSASEGAQDAMERTREYAGEFMERTGGNAIPLAMIGAGVAWLLVDRFRGDDRERHGSRWARRYEGPDEAYRTGYARDVGEPAYETEYDWNRARREREGSQAVGRVTSRAGDAASRARARALRAGRRTTSGLQRMIHDNPLLVGLGAMLIGAALGMALPETERENELMGEAKEHVVERAQDMARGAASRAQEAAGEAASEVASRVVTGKDQT